MRLNAAFARTLVRTDKSVERPLIAIGGVKICLLRPPVLAPRFPCNVCAPFSDDGLGSGFISHPADTLTCPGLLER
jgi:hypothetical protein